MCARLYTKHAELFFFLTCVCTVRYCASHTTHMLVCWLWLSIVYKIRQVVRVHKQFSFALFFVFVYVYICLCMYVFGCVCMCYFIHVWRASLCLYLYAYVCVLGKHFFFLSISFFTARVHRANEGTSIICIRMLSSRYLTGKSDIQFRTIHSVSNLSIAGNGNN